METDEGVIISISRPAGSEEEQRDRVNTNSSTDAFHWNCGLVPYAWYFSCFLLKIFLPIFILAFLKFRCIQNKYTLFIYFLLLLIK